jgi:plastocyanin
MRNEKRQRRLAHAVVLALAAANAGIVIAIVEPASAQQADDVTIDNFTFAPGVITVKAGDMVTWTNRDDIPHTVRADSGAWKCAVMDTGGSCQIPFKTAGEFSYFCSLHPKMTGKVIVRAD